MKTIALLVAAGTGSRAKGDMPKQYRQLGGKALIAHALDNLRHPLIDEIAIVIGPGQQALYADAVGGRDLPAPVIGGATRQESVRNGLESLAGRKDIDAILIHDAARPFLPAEVIERLIEALKEFAGAVPVLPVTDSLAVTETMLGDSISREKIVKVQTPQAFSFHDILNAHRQWGGGADVTDDARVARAAGIAVATVPGDARLAKLTYANDFRLAEEMLASRLVSRTGLGFDVHAFADGSGLWLGGIPIPHIRGLAGHSDADVVLHAITDALLGAIGEGDIGDHFPPDDPQWRGASSSVFANHALALIEARDGRIDHIDVTIICEAPKIGPHRAAMRENIARLLKVHRGAISIKATTTEHLGFTGRGEGIAAQAVATIRAPEMK